MKLPSQLQIHMLFEYKDGVLYWRKAQGKCAAGAQAGYVNTNGYVQEFREQNHGAYARA